MGVLAIRSESRDNSFCGRFEPAREERRLEDREEECLGDDEPDCEVNQYVDSSHHRMWRADLIERHFCFLLLHV